MADNPPAAVSASQTGDGAANGAQNANSHHTNSGDRNKNQRPGRGRQRGGGSRGGGRGGRGGGGRGKGFASKDQGSRNSRGEQGRGEWARGNLDKRKRNDEEQAAKRRKVNDGDEAEPQFSKEEIDAEDRKPKRKVAVMVGYAGSGYKGMQINGAEKTIEGDIFKAFVAAGAISKANADDPKKSSLVRCARTDKGVHAAGNVISLKLIVEDPNIIELINQNLPPQIRIWGIERTNGSFSCYQTCDSRWYEYLIPTYSFLPPHPESFLGKKLVESAEKEGVFETYQSKQEDVADFWKTTEETYVKPILDRLDPETREAVISALHSSEEDDPTTKQLAKEAVPEEKVKVVEEEGVEVTNPADSEIKDASATPVKVEAARENGGVADATASEEGDGVVKDIKSEPEISKSVLTPVEAAIKEIKAAYIVAKKAYRISTSRRQRVQEALNGYVGTRNFHNYTIQKTFLDPSAKRVIRSFKVGPDPIIINDTEWLSLKVHGQSFMMHQIRKMVAMVALVVRCGTPISIMNDSYGSANISIPKAPGLGLLLERPVFDSYNQKAVNEFKREKINFDKYQKEMDEFKQREIYDRIFREEERDHQFHAFFHHIDHFKTDYFLWVTASGLSAAKQSKAPGRTDDNSDGEADANGEEG
ncbi:hypothetical protein VTL71DRAFT_4607 [Oculimacula yallundae]|uniref:Pseudouridine synthase I TruA alpha/beta domain-containing protein n=1 Tax=Oculimacula yallundae TaxID=86028 RepID=A0ABR4C2J0_9HELO